MFPARLLIAPIALLCALAFAAVATAVAGPGSAAGRENLSHPAAGHPRTAVPAAAQGPISAELGRHDGRYRIIGLRARNPAQHLSARFASTGATIVSGTTSVRLRLSGLGRGSAMRPVALVAPRATGNRVDYARHGVREWWTNGPLGLEQGFDVASRPRADGHGPLTLALSVSGAAHARLTNSGIVLQGSDGHAVRYGGLTATDSRGRTLRSALAVRDGLIQVHVDDRTAVYPVRVDPFVQQAVLTGSDGAADDLLGAAVAISGDTLVASTLGIGDASNPSALYVFVKPASGWANATQTATLTAPDTDARSVNSVAISGDTIVAGAPGHTVGINAGQGAAFVFVKPAAGWKDARETATLTASDGARNEALGSTVAVSGGTVAVGAPGRTVGTNQIQGAVYVFVKPAARWKNTTQTAELTASDGATSDDLNSVSMSGDTIAAGAQSHTVGTHQAQGAIYVFVKPAFGWADATQTAELTASDGAAGDDLGAATVATNDTIVAGASQAQIANNKREGAAYVFVKPAAGWVDARQTAKLTASDGSTDDFFATNVGLSGGTVVAGAPGHALGANQLQGAVYLFVKPRSGWADASQTEELGNPSDVAAGGLFGYGVAISGTLVVASSPFETVGGNTRQGVVHLLAAPPTIALDNPADGGTFTQGQIADASFSCAAPTGATIIRCAGPVTADAPIDTSSLGAHVFTVGAIDSDGATATRSVKYTVTPGHGSTGPASRPPSISAVHQSAEVWRRGGKPARLALARKPPVGTTFSFALDQPATVTLSFGHRSAGRRTHGVCARPSAKNNRAARCTRTIAAGTLKLTGHRGPNRVHFEGRISPTRRLRPGQYTLTMTATNAAGQRASARALRFRIVK